MNNIVLFDGDCNFCNKSVQFIIKRDPNGLFKFASLQSEIGEQLLKQYNVTTHIDSIVLIDKNRAYVKSSAALRICKHLRGIWKLFYSFLIIPKPLRDIGYNLIAKYRYKWFGINHQCKIPTDEERSRFL
ncbi:MAG TPA: thiol-disulfide oxidoreductase DCC family protein [Pseudogracilibacillus sp.]|nr:thiol-disulfide oxidoreductase DCC family protein [Pseudogracilibacillus sp.]